MKYGFGIDVGGTTVKIAFFNTEGSMLRNWEIPTVTEDCGKAILPDIAASVQEYLNQSGIPQDDIIGIGIGVPGPVDNHGVVNKCVNLGWGVFNIQDELSRLTGFPVLAGNDANVAALGEAWKGGGKGCENMVLVTLGTGIGGGVILNGKILHGVHGAGAEIGHMTIKRDETEPCGCGKCGCVEQYCSANGVVRLAERKLRQSDAPSTLRTIFPLTSKDIFAASAEGDALANEILDQMYAYMGEFLANVCCVVDPEVLVLGGGMSKAGQPLLDGVKPYFEKFVFHACRGTRFELAALGNDAGAYGAFKMVLDAYGE